VALAHGKTARLLSSSHRIILVRLAFSPQA